MTLLVTKKTDQLYGLFKIWLSSLKRRKSNNSQFASNFKLLKIIKICLHHSSMMKCKPFHIYFLLCALWSVPKFISSHIAEISIQTHFFFFTHDEYILMKYNQILKMFTKIMGIYECSLPWCFFWSCVRDLLIWKICCLCCIKNAHLPNWELFLIKQVKTVNNFSVRTWPVE